MGWKAGQGFIDSVRGKKQNAYDVFGMERPEIRAKNEGEVNASLKDITGSPDYSPSGTLNERRGALEGLQRAKTLTGQTQTQIGQNFQEAFGNIKKRTTGSDPASDKLRASKAGAVASTRNMLQRQGMKGGAAARAVADVERAKDYDVNTLMQQNQRDAYQDFMSSVKGMANFTQGSEMNFRALASERDKQPVSQGPGGLFGDVDSVICTELYRQGYYSKEIYAQDVIYGNIMRELYPHVYIGYRAWADKVVPLMQKSKAFTKFVAFFAVPWARNMAGEKNLFGALISKIGEPICGLIGKIKLSRRVYEY